MSTKHECDLCGRNSDSGNLLGDNLQDVGWPLERIVSIVECHPPSRLKQYVPDICNDCTNVLEQVIVALRKGNPITIDHAYRRQGGE